jgi:hypothetical protein
MRRMALLALFAVVAALLAALTLTMDSKEPPPAHPDGADGPGGAGQGALDSSLSIRVFGIEGETRTPLSGARVALFSGSRDDHATPVRASRSGTTNGSGAVAFRRLETGSWVIQVSAPGYARAQEGIALLQEAHQAEMTLPALCLVGGTVVDASGVGCPSTTVEIAFPPGQTCPWLSPTSTALNRPGPAKVVTGQDGAFEFTDVLPGFESQLIVWAQSKGRAVVSVPTLQPGEERRLEIRVTSQTSVVGTVPFAIRPGSSFTVECFQHARTACQLVKIGNGRISEGQRFRVGEVSPGGVSVVVLELGKSE